MSDLFGNPKGRFSCVMAHLISHKSFVTLVKYQEFRNDLLQKIYIQKLFFRQNFFINNISCQLIFKTDFQSADLFLYTVKLIRNFCKNKLEITP